MGKKSDVERHHYHLHESSSSWHATTMGLSTKNYANIAAFIFNMVVAAAIGFGLVGESNEFVSAK